jgi:hypothetical protein
LTNFKRHHHHQFKFVDTDNGWPYIGLQVGRHLPPASLDPVGAAVGPNGNLFVSAANSGTIYMYTSTGQQSPFATSSRAMEV